MSVIDRSNFRVKLNLSKFYNDVRQVCWIFIDGTEIIQIHQLKRYIAKLFNIKEPFHLSLNDSEYLPPTEDIRILKENETIAAIPGSGLSTETKPTSNLFHNKETQTIDFIETKSAIFNHLNILSDASDNLYQDACTTDITFHSALENTGDDNTIESKANNSTVKEVSPGSEQITSLLKQEQKQKKKKCKKKTSSVKENNSDDENEIIKNILYGSTIKTKATNSNVKELSPGSEQINSLSKQKQKQKQKKKKCKKKASAFTSKVNDSKKRIQQNDKLLSINSKQYSCISCAVEKL